MELETIKRVPKRMPYPQTDAIMESKAAQGSPKEIFCEHNVFKVKVHQQNNPSKHVKQIADIHIPKGFQQWSPNRYRNSSRIPTQNDRLKSGIFKVNVRLEG